MKLCHLNKKLLLSPFIEGLYNKWLSIQVFKTTPRGFRVENFCIRIPTEDWHQVVNSGIKKKKKKSNFKTPKAGIHSTLDLTTWSVWSSAQLHLSPTPFLF